MTAVPAGATVLMQMVRWSQLVGSPKTRLAAGWGLRAVGPAVLAFLLIRVVDYGELRDLLGDLRVGWMVAAVAAVQLIIVLRTLRWIELHQAFGLRRAPFSYQLRLSYATSIASLALPQIVNPLSRLVLLVQDGYRAGRSLAAAVLEKLLEFGAYVAFGVFGSIALASTFGGLVWWAVGVALAALLAGGVLYAERTRLSAFALALLERMPGMGGGAATDREETAHEILALDRGVAVRLSVWSLAVAMTQATMLFFITRSLGVDLSYPFMVAVWGVVAFSLLLPISVNGIGTREAVLVAAFNAADRSTDAAVAIGLLTLVVVAVGSSPGLIEWTHRFIAGRGMDRDGQATTVTAPVQPQGDRRS